MGDVTTIPGLFSPSEAVSGMTTPVTIGDFTGGEDIVNIPASAMAVSQAVGGFDIPSLLEGNYNMSEPDHVSRSESSHQSLVAQIATSPSMFNKNLKNGYFVAILKHESTINPYIPNVVRAANIGDINVLLRNKWLEMLTAMLQPKKRGRVDPSIVNALLKRTEFEFTMSRTTEDSEWKTLMKVDGYKPIPMYMTKQGILDTVNLLGFQISDSQLSTSPQPNNASVSASVAVRGKAEEVTDYWGKEATPGTRLYFILKRLTKDRDDKSAPFAFVPYVLKDITIPPSDLAYFDLYGTVQHGAAFYVGRVQDVGSKRSSDEIIKKMCGLDPGATLPMANFNDSIMPYVQRINVVLDGRRRPANTIV